MKPEHDNKMLTPSENKGIERELSRYTLCERSFSAGASGPAHIRRTTGSKSMGSDTDALCGASVTWDISNPIDAKALSAKWICPACRDKYREVVRELQSR